LKSPYIGEGIEYLTRAMKGRKQGGLAVPSGSEEMHWESQMKEESMSRNWLKWGLFAMAGLAFLTGADDQALAQRMMRGAYLHGYRQQGQNYQTTVPLKLKVTGLENDMITPGECVSVAVDSGGFAKPPFSFTDSIRR